MMQEPHITENCPIETTLNLIGNKWKFLILWNLLSGTKRFGELKKSLGHISQKVLTQNLRELEAAGILHRQVYAEVPPRVEYSLTNLGKSLNDVFSILKIWGQNYQQSMQKS